MEDFTQAPISIGERKGMDDCRDWTPRELLVYMLRLIDKGELQPDDLVVLFAYKKGNGTVTGMKRSKATIREAVALCEIAKFDLLSQTSGD